MRADFLFRVASTNDKGLKGFIAKRSANRLAFELLHAEREVMRARFQLETEEGPA